MSVDTDTVRHIAKLARIAMSDEEFEIGGFCFCIKPLRRILHRRPH